MKKSVDQTQPRRFSHIKTVGGPAQKNRQNEIDNQNQKLLGKIMNIMKRKNKSVAQARAIPYNLIGGN